MIVSVATLGVYSLACGTDNQTVTLAGPPTDDYIGDGDLNLIISLFFGYLKF